MTSRVGFSISCLLALALAASCSSDEKQTTPVEAPGGGAGEAPVSAGGSAAVAGGGNGAATAGSSAGGGKPVPTGGSAGSGGSAAHAGSHTDSAGAESASAGVGAGGSAGEPNVPTGPVSSCGAGNYDAGEAGCTACPASPASGTTSIGCQAFSDASRDNDGNLLLTLHGLAIHEPFPSDFTIDWSADGLAGSATVPWEYSATLGQFTFYLPVEARYADEFTFGAWAFGDACGFNFTAGALRVYYGTDSWQCGAP